MKNIVVLYTEAGGGHKVAALALKDIIQKNPDYQVILINPFEEMYEKFDIIKKFTGRSSETVYNEFVSAHENSLIRLLLISLLFKFNLIFYRKKLIKEIEMNWKKIKFDMVVSVVPFINSLINDSLKNTLPLVPFVTLPTDYSECANSIWFTSKEQFLICGTQKLLEQAIQKGHPPDRIFRTSGMIVRPAFYEISDDGRNAQKSRLGLRSDLKTGLVMFGMCGSDLMLQIAKKMNNTGLGIQVIFICGKNKIMKKRIDALPLDYPILTTESVDDVQNYMGVSDFFIGKPGGASISEAAIMKLPIIVELNSLTLLQEKYNASWVAENKIGLCVKNFSNIAQAVKEVLDKLPDFKENYKQLSNRGIFEIPDILEKILKNSQIKNAPVYKV
jgi:1,2-diacylglycerol 3-beta-galactosyltransferase